eukprot:530077-Prymnesium_polylepis.2
MDRKKPMVAKCQSGFITFIVKPTFEAWAAYVPELDQLCMRHVAANLAMWAPDRCEVPPEACFADAAKEAWDPTPTSPGRVQGWLLKEGMEEFTYQGLPDKSPE